MSYGEDDLYSDWVEQTRKHFGLESDDEVTRELMDQYAEYSADFEDFCREEEADRRRDMKLEERWPT